MSYKDLPQDKIKELFTYVNGELVWNDDRPFHKTKGKVAGSVSKNGYKKCGYNGKEYYIHRLVYIYHHGNIEGQIDHIDGNKLNNNISNLRMVCPSQNSWNEKIRKTNTSGVKGVYFNKRLQKWHARVGFNSKELHVGYFDRIEDAEKAVKSKREQLHKEYARHF